MTEKTALHFHAPLIFHVPTITRQLELYDCAQSYRALSHGDESQAKGGLVCLVLCLQAFMKAGFDSM